MNDAAILKMPEPALLIYDRACKAIAEARAVDEVKAIRNKATAMANYARMAKNEQLELDAKEIRMRATRRLGQMMEEQKRTVGLNKGGAEPGIGRRGMQGNESPALSKPTRGMQGNEYPALSKPTLTDAGIDKNLAKAARKAAKPSDAEFEQEIVALRAPKKKADNGKKRSGPQPSRRHNSPIVEQTAASFVLDQGMTYGKAASEVGISLQTTRAAVAREEGRREAPHIDPDSLSLTAKEKLEIAIRQAKRKLEVEHLTRIRGLDEEVRQRVLAEGKEYLAMMKAREQEANETIALYQEYRNNSKPPFTPDQFKVILMCLHPDGQRTSDKLTEAFRLFNAKKLQLTGER